MQWSEFVNGCERWPERVIVRNIEYIETFGDGAEVAEILFDLPDEAACNRLVYRALEAGVSFSLSDVMEMDGSISNEIRDRFIAAIIHKQVIFSYGELEYLMGVLDDKKFSAVVLRQLDNGGQFSTEQIIEMITCGSVDENTANRLVIRSAKDGYVFEIDEIKELADYIIKSLIDALLLARAEKDYGISYEDLLYFADYLSEDVLVRLIFESIRSGRQYSPEQISEFDCYVSPETLVNMIKEKNPNVKLWELREIEKIISISTIYDMLNEYEKDN